MVVRRIVMVRSFSYKPDQKVSIHTLVMMKRNKVEIVKTKKGSDEEYHGAGDQPGAFGDLNSSGCFDRLHSSTSRGTKRLLPFSSLLTVARSCRGGTHLLLPQSQILRKTLRSHS